MSVKNAGDGNLDPIDASNNQSISQILTGGNTIFIFDEFVCYDIACLVLCYSISIKL
jgi:hypothetical protein